VRIPIPASAAHVSAAEPAQPADVAALARAYGRNVFRAAWRVLGARAAAEDVQQQVFLRLIEDPPADVRSWPAFLTTAATRLAIDHLRRQRRWALLAPLWKSDGAEEAPDVEAERAEEGRFMRRELARMNPRDAACFVLRHVQGMSPTEVATALGIRENNVSVIAHRARKALEAAYSQEQTR
jgi:RNA polymerase sigma factor (sigma-70 family)